MYAHYLAGSYAALNNLGLLKTADNAYVPETLSHATGGSGRLRQSTNEDPAEDAKSAFLEHDRQMDYPADESYQFSVGSGQSKSAAKASGKPHKIASNLNEIDQMQPVRTEPGSAEGEVPGEYLGIWGKLRNGNNSMPGGHPESSDDTVDRSFRYMDQDDGVRILDGDTAATPASPAV